MLSLHFLALYFYSFRWTPSFWQAKGYLLKLEAFHHVQALSEYQYTFLQCVDNSKKYQHILNETFLFLFFFFFLIFFAGFRFFSLTWENIILTLKEHLTAHCKMINVLTKTIFSTARKIENILLWLWDFKYSDSNDEFQIFSSKYHTHVGLSTLERIL